MKARVVLYEKKELVGYRRLSGLEMDVENELLFFTGEDDTLKITGCIDAKNGDIVWIRSFEDESFFFHFLVKLSLPRKLMDHTFM